MIRYCRKLNAIICACCLAFATTGACADDLAQDQLVATAHAAGGEVIPYTLTSKQPSTVKYALMARFDTRNLKSRQLIVHHKDDGCRVTPYSAAASNHEHYGTTLITMAGGITSGNPCEAFGYHGYNGIEGETVDQIKAWVKLDQ